MFKYEFVLATLSVVTAAVVSGSPQAQAAEATDLAASACNVARLTAMQTDFPQTSQSRGEHGDVVVKVTINKDGRAERTQVTSSSGYPALDEAATSSIDAYWRFDVSDCASSALPTNSLVTVQFQRAPQHTLSGTVNTRRATSTAQNVLAPSRCEKSTSVLSGQVTTCHLEAAAPVHSNAQPSLANRTDSATGK